MEPHISVISLNIEHAKHLDLIEPFLERENPEVFCVQELLEQNIPFFEKIAGKLVCFAPMAAHSGKVDPAAVGVMGVGIFSRLPAISRGIEYYFGNQNDIINFESNGLGIMNRALIYCDVEKGGKTFRIGTTHFTWTPDGYPSDSQRRDLRAFLGILEKAGEIVFTGDFNAARGREIFDEIARRYKDNVPDKYTNSIDNTFHRSENLELMIDGFFSTPAYKVSDVEMVCGLSDHCAIKARIS